MEIHDIERKKLFFYRDSAEYRKGDLSHLSNLPIKNNISLDFEASCVKDCIKNSEANAVTGLCSSH